MLTDHPWPIEEGEEAVAPSDHTEEGRGEERRGTGLADGV
jgi:hypothetical protein